MYIGDKHVYDEHVYCKYHVLIISFFQLSCPKPHGCIWCGFSLDIVWTFPIYFSSSLRCRKLALTRETLTLGVFIGVCILPC